MKNLEYQLESGKSILTHYNVSNEELSARLLTDYFTKNSVVYESAGSFDKNGEFVILLKEVENEEPYSDVHGNDADKYVIEYRIYDDDVSQRRLVKRIEFDEMIEGLPRLLLFKPLLDNNTYKRMSGEYDEDRNVYTIYLGE